MHSLLSVVQKFLFSSSLFSFSSFLFFLDCTLSLCYVLRSLAVSVAVGGGR